MITLRILSIMILVVIGALLYLVVSQVQGGEYYDRHFRDRYGVLYEPTRIIGPTDSPPMTIIPGDGHEPTRIIGPVDSPPMTVIPGSHGHPPRGYYDW